MEHDQHTSSPAAPPSAPSDAPLAAPSPLPVPRPLEGEALRDAIVHQVEYYLSRQNLANDYFLVSHMNAELYVPLAVIVGMPKIKALSADVDVVAGALKSSTQLVVDPAGRAVKPTFKLSRNTIILRDIPPDVPAEEVAAIFKSEVCGKLISLRPDVGDCWFVQLEDEDHARHAIEHLATQQFRGKRIGARIKSENLLRAIPAGYHQSQHAAPDGAAGAPAFARGPYPPRGGGFYPPGGAGRPYEHDGGYRARGNGAAYRPGGPSSGRGGGGGGGGGAGGAPRSDAGGAAGARKDPLAPPTAAGAATGLPGDSGYKPRRGGKGAPLGARKAPGGPARLGSAGASAGPPGAPAAPSAAAPPKPASPPPQLGSAHFPPLPSKGAAGAMRVSADDEPAAASTGSSGGSSTPADGQQAHGASPAVPQSEAVATSPHPTSAGAASTQGAAAELPQRFSDVVAAHSAPASAAVVDGAQQPPPERDQPHEAPDAQSSASKAAPAGRSWSAIVHAGASSPSAPSKPATPPSASPDLSAAKHKT